MSDRITNGDEILTNKQVADLLHVCTPTVDRWRPKGEGPRWFRVGRQVRYRLADVERFILANMSKG